MVSEHLCRKCIQSCWELAQILQVCISSSSFYTGLQLNMFGHHCNNNSPKPTWVILLPTDSSWNFQPLTFENVQLVRMCCINIMCQPSLWHFPLSLKPFILSPNYLHFLCLYVFTNSSTFLGCFCLPPPPSPTHKITQSVQWTPIHFSIPRSSISPSVKLALSLRIR